MTRLAIAIAPIALFAAPAAAQDGATYRNVVIGAGVQTVPRYPGSGDSKVTVLPVVETWKSDQPRPVKVADDASSFALIGKRGSGFAIGPSFAVAPTRSADDLPGLDPVKFGIEAGGFAEYWPSNALRLRVDLRQGIGAHKALTGAAGADLVIRPENSDILFTVGPRVRWGSAKYNRAYFGVPVPGAGGFAAYDPSAGIYAYGAAAGMRLPLAGPLGLYGYARYDRLTDRVAASPIVNSANGSRDQFSAGVALTYRFGI